MVDGGRIALTDGVQTPLRVGLAATPDLVRQPPDISGIELDHAADRLGTPGQVRQLTFEPIHGRSRVGVGGGDQPVRQPEGLEPLGRGIHPESPGRSRSRAGAVQHREPQAKLSGPPASHRLGLVLAGVGHEDHLEGGWRDRLPGERLQACRRSDRPRCGPESRRC